MNWLRENWFWLAVVILFVWMHTKMHGGHGRHLGHGGHAGHGGGGGGHGAGQDDEQRSEPTEDSHAQH